MFERLIGNAKPVFCSIDLIPQFDVEKIGAFLLAKLVNEGLLGPDNPLGWFWCLKNYINKDRVVHELLSSEHGMDKIASVALKTISCNKTKNHYVRPGQVLPKEKFQTEELKNIYCHIKALVKMFNLNISMFIIKKELMKPKFKGATDLVQVLSEPELRPMFEGVVDLDRSMADDKIPKRLFTAKELDLETLNASATGTKPRSWRKLSPFHPQISRQIKSALF